METNMNREDVNSFEQSGDGTQIRRANTRAYLETAPATTLMILKVAEGMGKLCAAIVCAALVNTVIAAVNKTLQQESIAADLRSMVAQILSMLKVPASDISQVVETIPSQLNFAISGRLVSMVFFMFMPFALFAILEAIAAVRLRFGKGGARMLQVLETLYCAVEFIGILAAIILAIFFSASTIQRLGFTAGAVISVVYLSLGVFYILIRTPYVLYHLGIAGAMKGIGSEMATGVRSLIRAPFLQGASIILIVFTIISAIVSIGSASELGAGGYVFGALIVPVIVIIKYTCLIVSYQNYARAEGSEEEEDKKSRSHTPLVIVIVVLALLFATPTVILCAVSGRISSSVAESVSTYVSETKDAVDRVSAQVEAEEKRLLGGTAPTESAQGAGTAAPAADTQPAAEAAPAADTQPAAEAAPAADTQPAAENAQGAGSAAPAADTQPAAEAAPAGAAQSAAAAAPATQPA